jgi:PAS domain S-box-containing protein
MLEFISHQIGISIERKRTEQDLKLMGKAFDQSPVTIAITDRDGNIEYVNPKFSETTGYTLDEVKGKNPRVLQSGQQSKEYYKNLWETILAGNDWFGEFQNKRKNGESYWESAVISPITNDNGDIAFFLAIKEDITEKKKMIDDLIQARNKAEESDRLKSSFLANMSHEIRTPLNSIIGFSELLLDKDFGTEQHEEFARTINESGNGLLTIISDIMDFSKIEAGQILVKKKKFSVNELINSLQKEYSYKASEKGIELRLDPTNPLDKIFIESDEQRIRQILINFVGNALKFTEKGFVEIGFNVNENLAHFQVKDSGIGISEEYHQQIFERFRQVESSHTRKYGGNGLGLAISKNLVELLGGEIGMISEVGIGSIFYFTLPVS